MEQYARLEKNDKKFKDLWFFVLL